MSNTTVKWYRTLLSYIDEKTGENHVGLLDAVHRTNQTFIVAWSVPNIYFNFGDVTSEPFLVFAAFDTYIHFYNYMQKLEPHQRTFFEVILGDTLQKVHFDIDVKLKEYQKYCPTAAWNDLMCFGQRILEVLIENLKHFIPELSLEEDIIVCDSMSADVNSRDKVSYHVVVTNFCCRSNLEAGYLYKRIITRIQTRSIVNEYKLLDILSPLCSERIADIIISANKDPLLGQLTSWIDHAVYKSKQQFRLLGSTKIRSRRHKKFNTSFKYNGKDIIHIPAEPTHLGLVAGPESERERELIQFASTLVTVVDDAVILPSFAFESELAETKDKTKYGGLVSETPTRPHEPSKYDPKAYKGISKEHVQKCFALLVTYLARGELVGVSGPAHFPFKLGQIRHRLIMLKRVHASQCPLCKRRHENENSYLTVSVVGKVTYYCRRNETGKGEVIGTLEGMTPASETIPKPQEEMIENHVVGGGLTNLSDLSNFFILETAQGLARRTTESTQQASAATPVEQTKGTPTSSPGETPSILHLHETAILETVKATPSFRSAPDVSVEKVSNLFNSLYVQDKSNGTKQECPMSNNVTPLPFATKEEPVLPARTDRVLTDRVLADRVLADQEEKRPAQQAPPQQAQPVLHAPPTPVVVSTSDVKPQFLQHKNGGNIADVLLFRSWPIKNSDNR